MQICRAPVLVLALLVTSCADSTSVKSLGEDQTRLDPTKTFYISMPEDGRYAHKPYRDSGDMTADIVRTALARHVTTMKLARYPETLDEAIRSAEISRASYLVYSDILAWEDRATEWSGRPDRVSVRISIIDARSGSVLNAAVIDGKSGLATFGGDHPQDLLPEPVDEYVGSLF